MTEQKITMSDRDFSFGIDQISTEDLIQPGYVEDLVNGYADGKSIRKRKGQEYYGAAPINCVAIDSQVGQLRLLFAPGSDSTLLAAALAINGDIEVVGSVFYTNTSTSYSEPLYGYRKYKLHSLTVADDYVNFINDADLQLVTGDRVAFTHSMGTTVTANTDIRLPANSYYVSLRTTTNANPPIASYTLHSTRADAIGGNNIIDLSSAGSGSPLPGYAISPRIIERRQLRLLPTEYDVGYLPEGLAYISFDSLTATILADTIPCIISVHGAAVGDCYEDIQAEHIDSYRNQTTSELLIGAEGVQYAAKSDTGVVPSYPYIRGYFDTPAQPIVIGPAIYDTGEVANRTSGYVTVDNGQNHFVKVTGFEFVSTGICKITCNAQNYVTSTSGSVDSIIIPGLDQITLDNMHREVLNGAFSFLSISELDANTWEILVLMSAIIDSRYDQLTGLFGHCYALTDRIAVGSSSLLVGDIINHWSLKEVGSEELAYDAVVVAASATDVVIGPVREVITLEATRTVGTEIVPTDFLPAIRTSATIPVRGPYGGAEGYFNNDDINKSLQYIQIIEAPGMDGFTVYDTVEIFGADSLVCPLKTGKRYVIIDFYQQDPTKLVLGYSATDEVGIEFGGTDPYVDMATYVFVIKNITCDIVSGDVVTFTNSDYNHRIVSSSFNTDIAGVTNLVLPYTITATDDELNSEAISIAHRFTVLTAPVDDFQLTAPTLPVNITDNTTQTRSASVNGCMYLTNYTDSVRKYDGQNLYTAGLPPFQASIGIKPSGTSVSKIAVPGIPVTCTMTQDSNVITVTTAANLQSAEQFRPGDLVYPVGTNVTPGQYLTVVSSEFTDTVPATAVRTIVLSGNVLGSGALTGTSLYRAYALRYYFRFIYTDYQGNRIPSAASDLDSCISYVYVNTALELVISNLPVFDRYKYASIDLEIYRTKLDSFNNFYKNTTITVPFDIGNSFLYYVDSKSDDFMTEVDEISSALLGSEVGTTWSPPPRAKCITAVDNQLVLGNIKTSPSINMEFIDPGLAYTDYANLVFCVAKQPPVNVSTTVSDYSDPSDYIHQFIFTNTVTKAASTITVTHSSVTGLATFTASGGAIANLAAGDWVQIISGGYYPGKYAGWHQVHSVSSPAFTIRAEIEDAGVGEYAVVADTSGRVPVYLSTTITGATGSFVNAFQDVPSTSDSANLITFLLSRAINATMSSVDITLDSSGSYPQYDWSPWLIARLSGSRGQLSISSPTNDTIYGWFEPKAISVQTRPLVTVNGIRRTTGEIFMSETRLYPSRLAVSYPNYPEVFDNLDALLPDNSDSIFDIDSSNGEEITATVPFFGEAAFDQSKQSAHVVVFKERSIYIVDLRQKDLYRRTGGSAGLPNPVQKLETNGIGCNMPYSVAVSKYAIFFANDAGIWALRRDLKVQPMDSMSRIWDRLTPESMVTAHGHNNPLSSHYMLSVPLDSDETCNDVVVYNYSNEEEGRIGAWSRYSNYPALGWANIDYRGYFLSRQGAVWGERNEGLSADYSDDGTAISTEITFRAMDFGDPAIGKVVKYGIITYKPYTQIDSVRLYSSADFTTAWSATGTYSVDLITTTDNLSDAGNYKIVQLRHSFADARGAFFQLKLIYDGVNEAMDVCGVHYRASGLDDKTILDAGKTSINNS